MRHLAVIALVCACSSKPISMQLGQPTRQVLDVDTNGLSGLAADGDRLWSVAERGKSLVLINADGSARKIPIASLPDGYDLESIARVGKNRLAIGTETAAELWSSAEGQSRAKILFVEAGAAAEVSGSVDLPFSLWDVKPAENQGIEGLCVAGDRLLAGIETIVERGGKRYAPLASRLLSGDGPWTPFLLELSSAKGKLSSLDCRSTSSGTEVLAVERHFGIMRILHFRLPDRPQDVIVPVVVADLTKFTANGNINIEGIAWFGEQIAMVVDNEYKTITGPNELIFAPISK